MYSDIMRPQSNQKSQATSASPSNMTRTITTTDRVSKALLLKTKQNADEILKQQDEILQANADILTNKQKQYLQDQNKDLSQFAQNIETKAYLQVEQLFDLDEIDLIYRRQQSNKGGIWTQIILVVVFFLYLSFEMIDLAEAGGLAKILESKIENETKFQSFLNQNGHVKTAHTEAKNSDFVSQREESGFRVLNFVQNSETLQDWIYFAVWSVFENENDKLENLMQDQLSNLDEEDRAQINVLQNVSTLLKGQNYVAGMRLNVVDASYVKTENSILEDVLSERRVNVDSLHDSPDLSNLNQTSAQDSIFYDADRTLGYFEGQGISVYIPSKMSREEALAIIDQVNEEELISNKNQLVALEIMLFSENIQIGLVFTYTFHLSNTGLLEATKTNQVFMPSNYDYTSQAAIFKSIMMGIFALQTLIQTIQLIILVKNRLRSLLVYKINEFYLSDYLSIIQVTLSIVFITMYCLLFLRIEYQYGQFEIPFAKEEEFEKWVGWSRFFGAFQECTGIFSILAVLNLLLIGSNYVPSLGILFETINRSISDFIVFSLIFQLFFCMMVVACHTLFGEKEITFSKINMAYLTCSQMVFGELQYSKMYKADPKVAAIVFVLFVIFFCFLCLNMYKAIVIEKYNELRMRKLLLSEALAKVQFMELISTIKSWIRLLFCMMPYSNQNRGYEDSTSKFGQGSGNDLDPFENQVQKGVINQQDDEEKDGGRVITIQQRFQQNWAFVSDSRIVTKEQFINKVKVSFVNLLREKDEDTKQRISKLSGTNAQTSFKILKNIFKMILFLAISYTFYVNVQEAFVKRTVKEPIKNYINKLNKNGLLDEGVSLTSEQDLFTQLFSDFNLTQIGSSHLLGTNNTMRINMRFYDVIENKNRATSQIFPLKIGSLSTIPTHVHSKEQAFDRVFVKGIFQYLTGNLGEQKESFAPLTIPGLNNSSTQTRKSKFVINQRVYTQAKTEKYDSLYDEGGFVYYVDRQNNLILPENETISLSEGTDKISLQEFLTPTNQLQFSSFSSFGVDWLMYNPNYDQLIYCALQIQFKTNGQLRLSSVIEPIRSHVPLSHLILFSLFLVFYLVTVISFLVRIFKEYKKVGQSQDSNNTTLNYGNSRNKMNRQQRMAINRGTVEDQQTCTSKILRFLGIDIARLRGQNFIVIIVLSLFMIIAKIFKSLWKILKTFFNFASSSIFHFLEIMLIVVTYRVISIYFVLLRRTWWNSFELDNPNLLPEMNELVHKINSIDFWMSISICINFFRVLELLEFSLTANLPILTLSAGRQDIANWLVIYIVFLFGSSMACYVQYGPRLFEFESAQRALYSILKLYMSDFSILTKMWVIDNIFTTIFFISTIILNMIFMVSIFIGVIVGHFNGELTQVNKLIEGKNLNLMSVLYRIFQVVYGEFKDEAKQKNQGRILICRKMCSMPRFIESLIDKILQYDKYTEEKYKAEDSSPNKLTSLKEQTSAITNIFSKYQLKNSKLKDSDINAQLSESTAPNVIRTNKNQQEAAGLNLYLKYFDDMVAEEAERNANGILANTPSPYDDRQQQQRLSSNLGDSNGEFGGRLEAGSATRGGTTTASLGLLGADYHVTGVSSKIVRNDDKNKKERESATGGRTVLNLQKKWEEGHEADELLNMNFWLHNLEQQISLLTKKTTSLYDFKNFDCFYTDKMFYKKGKKLTKMSKAYTSMTQVEAMNFFASKVSVEEKYLAWKSIDFEERRQKLKSLFDEDLKSTHGDALIQLVTQLEGFTGPQDTDRIEQLEYQIEKLSKSVPFKRTINSKWRSADLHKTAPVLLRSWRYCLTIRERFFLWFKFFDSTERVRLWNQLVFAREWFRRIINFSRLQDSSKSSKFGGILSSVAITNIDKQQRGDFYRKDLSVMLRQLAMRMYERGVTNEEILMHKIGNKNGESLLKMNSGGRQTFDMGVNLTQLIQAAKKSFRGGKEAQQKQAEHIWMQIQVRDEVYTSEELQKLWTQFFVYDTESGYYLQERSQIKTQTTTEDLVFPHERTKQLDNRSPNSQLIPQRTPPQGNYQSSHQQLISKQLKKPKDDTYQFEGGESEKYQTDQANSNDIQVEDAKNIRRDAEDLKETPFIATAGQEEKKRTLERFEQIQQFFKVMVDHNQRFISHCKLNKKDMEASALRASSLHQHQAMGISYNPASTLFTTLEQDKKEDFSNKMLARSETFKDFTESGQARRVLGGNRKDLDAEVDDANDIDNQIQEATITKQSLFEQLSSSINQEEERLQLWMLMSKRDKVDLLAHQVVDHEAQILALLIENEYGQQANVKKQESRLLVDQILEMGLEQQIFKKYIAYTKLQATFQARKNSERVIEISRQEDNKLLNYASFLKDRLQDTDLQIFHLKAAAEKTQQENEKIRNNLIEIAQVSLGKVNDAQKKEQILRKYTAEQIALAQRFYQDHQQNLEENI